MWRPSILFSWYSLFEVYYVLRYLFCRSVMGRKDQMKYRNIIIVVQDNSLISFCSVFVEYGKVSESRGFAAFFLAACRRQRQLRVPQARRPGDGGGFAHACDRLRVRRDRRNTDSRARACVPEAALRAARFNSDHTSVYREISRRHSSRHAADASVAGGSANHWRLEDFGSAAPSCKISVAAALDICNRKDTVATGLTDFG